MNTWANFGRECTSLGLDWYPDQGLFNPLAFPPMLLLRNGNVPSRWGKLDFQEAGTCDRQLTLHCGYTAAQKPLS